MKAHNPKHRGLRPNPEALGVTLLREGEGTQPMRVRAAAEVLAWASGLTATQRGQILAAAYAGQVSAAGLSEGADFSPDLEPTPTPDPVPHLRRVRVAAGLSEPLVPTGLKLGRVLSRTRAGLTPSQLQLVTALENGAELHRQGIAGSFYIVSKGEIPCPIHSGSVNALKRAGLLRG